MCKVDLVGNWPTEMLAKEEEQEHEQKRVADRSWKWYRNAAL